jgi:hypothetical protein
MGKDLAAGLMDYVASQEFFSFSHIWYFRTENQQAEACPTRGRSRDPLQRSRPRTVNEVPRRQSTGPFAPRDVVAEIEDVKEVVFEGETEDGVEPGLEIESEAAGARRSRGVPDRSILRLIFMAAPKFSAAPFTNRGAKIASGPFTKINN